MPISKVQLPSSNTPVDIRNGHSANVTYANGTFSATVSTVRTPYAGLILTLYFPTQLDIEAGVKTVTLTFADGNNYTAQFMILGYSYEYVVPVLIQIKSITSGVLDYDIIHKGSVPSGRDCMSMEVDSVDDTQLNFLENSSAQSTVVITYPDEDIEGTSYEVYAGSEIPQPSVADYGKVIGVDENGEYTLENVPNELPATTEIDAGKIVKVNASGTGYELGEGGGSGLPEYTASDRGKVLTIAEGEGGETVEPKWEPIAGDNFVRVYDDNKILSDSIKVISDIDGTEVEYTSGKPVLSTDYESMSNTCLLADHSVVTSPIVMVIDDSGYKTVALTIAMFINVDDINPFVPPSGANMTPDFYVKEILPNAKILFVIDHSNSNKPLALVDANYVTLGYGYTEKQA